MAVSVSTDVHIVEELEARLEAKKAELRDIATMGTVITSIHEINAVLSVFVDMALRIVGGEVGLVMLEEGNQLAQKIAWGVGPEVASSIQYEGSELAIHCFEKAETVVMNDLGLKYDSGLVIQCAIGVPIKTASDCFGVILIFNKTDGGGFSDEDRDILEMLNNFVAVAIDNSHMIKSKLKQQKTDQEVAIARQIQETILPSNVDAIDGVDIGTVYFPAGEVGGDFYDIISLGPTKFLTVIGDVSNKGIPAAMIMSAAAGIIKSIMSADPGIEVSSLATNLNDHLADGIIRDRDMFVTLFFAIFDLDRQRLSYCNAGHMPGLLWDSNSSTVIELSDGGPIVGQFPGIKYTQGDRPLCDGDRLFLFTDGLTEAENKAGQLLGREEVERLFKSHIDLPPTEFCRHIRKHIDQYSLGSAEESRDDFTLLQVKVG